MHRRFKLQNHLTAVAPKVKKIEDYELRIEQFTEMLKKWYVSESAGMTNYGCLMSLTIRDQDVERVKSAESSRDQYRSRLYQLETVLRAVEKEKKDQPEMIRQVIPADASMVSCTVLHR